VAGKRYRLERATNLTLGFNQTLGTNIADTAPTNAYPDTNAVNRGPFFYRVRLE
jgi:hypothetical protein